MIKGIIFDFNKIISGEHYEYEVLQEIFHENNGFFPLSLWRSAGVKADFNPFLQLEKQTKKKFNHEILNKIKTQRFFKRISSEKGRPEVEEVLNKAAEKGIKVGLAANFDYKWVVPYLEKVGYMDKIDCIKTSDECEKTKSGLEIYKEVAASLALKPEECVILGNPARETSPEKAGLYFVASPNKLLGVF